MPFFGDLLVMVRLLRDRDAPLGLKLLMVAALAYVVSPIDALPEVVVPLIGFLDDVGIVLALRLILDRNLAKYRYPLFEGGSARPSYSSG